jgi:hypothetical protein
LMTVFKRPNGMTEIKLRGKQQWKPPRFVLRERARENRRFARR